MQIIRQHWAVVVRVLPAALSSSLWADKALRPATVVGTCLTYHAPAPWLGSLVAHSGAHR